MLSGDQESRSRGELNISTSCRASAQTLSACPFLLLLTADAIPIVIESVGIRRQHLEIPMRDILAIEIWRWGLDTDIGVGWITVASRC